MTRKSRRAIDETFQAFHIQRNSLSIGECSLPGSEEDFLDFLLLHPRLKLQNSLKSVKSQRIKWGYSLKSVDFDAVVVNIDNRVVALVEHFDFPGPWKL